MYFSVYYAFNNNGNDINHMFLGVELAEAAADKGRKLILFFPNYFVAIRIIGSVFVVTS